jgi:uncharacterized membrane protein YozB (DUF420 family)
MPRQGFLGVGAPLSADVTVVIEIAMGVTLVLGMLLARRQRYRAHGWCQSTVVVLNLIVIAQVMAPTFRSQVAPKIPARLARPYYAVATGHAIIGFVAELLGVYIVLAAGTKILPESLRLVRYKFWMRIALVIWWLALLLGLTTYARWYVEPKRFSSTGVKVPARKTSLAFRSDFFRSRMAASTILSTPCLKPARLLRRRESLDAARRSACATSALQGRGSGSIDAASRALSGH